MPKGINSAIRAELDEALNEYCDTYSMQAVGACRPHGLAVEEPKKPLPMPIWLSVPAPASDVQEVIDAIRKKGGKTSPGGSRQYDYNTNNISFSTIYATFPTSKEARAFEGWYNEQDFRHADKQLFVVSEATEEEVEESLNEKGDPDPTYDDDENDAGKKKKRSFTASCNGDDALAETFGGQMNDAGADDVSVDGDVVSFSFDVGEDEVTELDETLAGLASDLGMSLEVSEIDRISHLRKLTMNRQNGKYKGLKWKKVPQGHLVTSVKKQADRVEKKLSTPSIFRKKKNEALKPMKHLRRDEPAPAQAKAMTCPSCKKPAKKLQMSHKAGKTSYHCGCKNEGVDEAKKIRKGSKAAYRRLAKDLRAISKTPQSVVNKKSESLVAEIAAALGEGTAVRVAGAKMAGMPKGSFPGTNESTNEGFFGSIKRGIKRFTKIGKARSATARDLRGLRSGKKTYPIKSKSGNTLHTSYNQARKMFGKTARNISHTARMYHGVPTDVPKGPPVKAFSKSYVKKNAHKLVRLHPNYGKSRNESLITEIADTLQDAMTDARFRKGFRVAQKMSWERKLSGGRKKHPFSWNKFSKKKLVKHESTAVRTMGAKMTGQMPAGSLPGVNESKIGKKGKCKDAKVGRKSAMDKVMEKAQSAALLNQKRHFQDQIKARLAKKKRFVKPKSETAVDEKFRIKGVNRRETKALRAPASRGSNMKIGHYYASHNARRKKRAANESLVTEIADALSEIDHAYHLKSLATKADQGTYARPTRSQMKRYGVQSPLTIRKAQKIGKKLRVKVARIAGKLAKRAAAPKKFPSESTAVRWAGFKIAECGGGCGKKCMCNKQGVCKACAGKVMENSKPTMGYCRGGCGKAVTVKTAGTKLICSTCRKRRAKNRKKK